MGAQVHQLAKESAAGKTGAAQPTVTEDEFLDREELIPVKEDMAKRRLREAYAEMGELIRNRKWDDAAAMFHPIEEKMPELQAFGLGHELREKVAFILGQLGRYDDAIRELQICIEQEPENFYAHSSLAYTAYDSLWAAKNRDIMLSSKARKQRIELAHRHFRRAQELRPDGVTNFYRQGMLAKEFENSPERALPFFMKALANWEGLDAGEQEARHQERKNFIKAMYQAASCFLRTDRASKALIVMKRCLQEDEKSNHLSLVFKYFALGKIQFHLGNPTAARDALLFALQADQRGGPQDFVCELLARVYLALNNPEKALETVNRVPEKRRRPYVRWTEADVLCAQGKYEQAQKVLAGCCERDQRARHKGLVRLARIAYLLSDFNTAFDHAAAADRFCREKWGNPNDDALFWQAASAWRAGDLDKAREMAEELRDWKPYYPKLGRLMANLREGSHATV